MSLFCQWTLHLLLNFISDNETERYKLGLGIGIPATIVLTIAVLFIMYGIRALWRKYCGRRDYDHINDDPINVQQAHDNNPFGNQQAHDNNPFGNQQA